jgi:hypothetical protein
MATKSMTWSEIKKAIQDLRSDKVPVEVSEDFPTEVIDELIVELLKTDLTE